MWLNKEGNTMWRSLKIYVNRFKAKKKNHQFFGNSIQADVNDDFIKVVPVGEFPEHPDGAHVVTADHIRQMKKNFDASRVDGLVDYEHNSLWGDTTAAGWVEEVEARDDGLYAKYPQFTKAAKKKIANREFRYLSPVYALNARDKKGKSIGAYFDSLALTNRPYMDNEIDHLRNTNTENSEMKFSKEFLESLGLDESATAEQIEEAMNAKLTESPPAEETPPSGNESEDPAEEGGDDPVMNMLKKMNSRLEAIEARDADAEKQNAEALVNSAIEAKKILPREKAVYLNSALTDFKATKETLDAIKANAASPSSVRVNDDEEGNPPKKKNSRLAAAEHIASLRAAS